MPPAGGREKGAYRYIVILITLIVNFFLPPPLTAVSGECVEETNASGASAGHCSAQSQQQDESPGAVRKFIRPPPSATTPSSNMYPISHANSVGFASLPPPLPLPPPTAATTSAPPPMANASSLGQSGGYVVHAGQMVSFKYR